MATSRESDRTERRRAWQRARRQAARQHHPDTGGSVEDYRDQMRLVDLRFGEQPARARPTAGAVPRRVARLVRSTRRRARRGARTVRSRLPRRVPGARRYIDLPPPAADRPDLP